LMLLLLLLLLLLLWLLLSCFVTTDAVAVVVERDSMDVTRFSGGRGRVGLLCWLVV
jgi:hypothetical protein